MSSWPWSLAPSPDMWRQTTKEVPNVQWMCFHTSLLFNSRNKIGRTNISRWNLFLPLADGCPLSAWVWGGGSGGESEGRKGLESTVVKCVRDRQIGADFFTPHTLLPRGSHRRKAGDSQGQRKANSPLGSCEDRVGPPVAVSSSGRAVRLAWGPAGPGCPDLGSGPQKARLPETLSFVSGYISSRLSRESFPGCISGVGLLREGPPLPGAMASHGDLGDKEVKEVPADWWLRGR